MASTTSTTSPAAVNGTAGNEILTLPKGTTLVNGGGGVDIVSLGNYQYFSAYKIVRNTDGSISVTDNHGGSLTNTKMVGISYLQFSDGAYNVATGQFVAGMKAALPVATTNTAPVTATPVATTPVTTTPVATTPVATTTTPATATAATTTSQTTTSPQTATADTTRTVNGTSGNDMITVPAKTTLVQGGGGTDIVSLGAYQYYASYKIVRNTDGSISVTDNHGGALTNAKMVGISYLQFTDGAYNVATGQFTAGMKATLPAATSTSAVSSTPVTTPTPVPPPPPPPAPVLITAEAPTLATVNATGSEGAAIALSINSSLTAHNLATGSLSIVIAGLPAGATLNHGVLNANGTWTLTPAQLGGLTVTPPPGFAGNFALTVTATDIEASTNTQASTSGALAVTVNPVAQAPTLIVGNGQGAEGASIALSINSSLPAHDLGTGSLSIVVAGLPAGATLNHGIHNNDGTWTLTSAQLSGLTVTPPPGFAGNLGLTVTATDTEASTNTQASVSSALSVTVNPVAQAPILTLATGPTVGSEGTSIALSINSSLPPHDLATGSLSIVIAGLPAGAMLNHGTLNNDGSWTLTPAQLTGLAVTPPPGFAGNLALTITATDTEVSTNTQASVSGALAVTVNPIAQAPTLTLANDGIVTGSEGAPIPLTIDARLPAHDVATGALSIVIAGLPTGAALNHGVLNDDGTWTLTPAQLADLSVTPPPGFAGNFALSVTATDKEVSTDTEASVSSNLAVTVNPIAQAPTLTVVNGLGTASTAIPLSISSALPPHDAATGSLSINLSGLPSGATLNHGIRNVDGSWTLNSSDLVGLKVTPATGYTGSFTLGVTATDVEINGTRASTSATMTVDVEPQRTVHGTTGNDLIAVPAKTELVKGDGGTDIVSMGSYQYYASYKIVRNTDGSISVTDNHGGSLSNAKMVGISYLQFSDGAYNVATGQFTAGMKAALPAAAAGSPTVAVSADAAHTVTGTAGNDTLAAPTGTQLVDGGSGTDLLSVGDYQYFSNYQIVRNGDGSLNLTDTHGGALNNTRVVNVETLKFADGTYDVASGQFTPQVQQASTGAASSSTWISPTVTVKAPAVAEATGAHDVVGFQLQNNGAAAIGPRVVTFGQSFAEGDVPRGSHLVATINGQEVSVQMDVKVTNADGSVAQAVLTIQAPDIGANSSVGVMLSSASGSASGTALDPHSFIARGYDTAVNLTFHNADGTTSAQRIDVGSALSNALASGTAKTWLSGPLASEVRVSVPINGSMTAQFDIRANADGTFVTDVAIQNDKIFSSASKTYTYDIAVTSHGQSLLSQSNVQQAPMQDWERVIWSDARGAVAAPTDHLVYDVGYLQESGAVPTYETSTGVSQNLLTSQAAQLAASNTNALGSGTVLRYEPTTGARPDIGPMTQWAADWLTTQSQIAEQIMDTNAAVSASIPIHALNADGSLVTVLSNPNFWLDARNSQNTQTVNYGTIESQSGWTPDTAHMPDLAYLSALTSGNRYLLDQVQAQANYDLLSMSPNYRADDGGLLGQQERGIAWTIRDLTNAAYLTPDGDPLKAYFTGQLEGIIQNLLATYVHGAAGAAQGDLHGYILGGVDNNQVAPWQQGYLAIALGQAAVHGIEGAAEVLGWMNNFLTGLYLNGDTGFNPLEGSGYWLTVGTGSLQSHNFHSFTTWSQFYNANFAGQPDPTSLNGYTNDAVGGFSTIAKAALATAWNVTHDVEDLAAYAYVTQNTEVIFNASGYAQAATWNITPTLGDGHQLQNNEVYYGHNSTVIAPTSHGLLAAAFGNNVLQAGNGDSILIGGAGTDVLKGGAGDDFLFAGTGNQTLYGGAGVNYLEGHLNGGSGVDHFQFNAADAAHDTVVNYKPGFDTLDITGAAQGVTGASLLATATTDAAGDVVLHLSAQHDVVLQGLHLSQLDPHYIHVG